jgi:hypothetical protein
MAERLGGLTKEIGPPVMKRYVIIHKQMSGSSKCRRD